MHMRGCRPSAWQRPARWWPSWARRPVTCWSIPAGSRFPGFLGWSRTALCPGCLATRRARRRSAISSSGSCAVPFPLTADISRREVLAAPVPHASAVGAAIYAATAAGVSVGGYADLRDAIRRMGSRERIAYRPRTSEQRLYESLYRDYLDLARHFGEGGTALMKRLRRLRAGSG